MKILDDIRKLYLQLDNDTYEANIERKIVEKFLVYQGYDESWFEYQYPTSPVNTTKVDINIYINNNRNILFFVEVKRKNHQITPKEIGQLAGYLNDKNIEWGLLSNGNRYILLNNKIDAPAPDKVVFEYFLIHEKNGKSKEKNKLYLNHLSKSSLFDSEITKYLCYLSEFLLRFRDSEHNLSMIGRQYESAIYGFIGYLIEKEHSFDFNYINTTNFTKYLTKINTPQKYSKQSLENKYRYILSFINFLEAKGLMQNAFKNIDLNSVLSKSGFKQEIKLKDSITKNEIMELLSYFDTCRYPLRNKLVLTLLIYGFDIEDIITLKDDQIDLKKAIIKIKNKPFKITQNLYILLSEHLNEKKKNKVKIKYTLYTKHEKSYKQLKYNTLSEIINNSFNSINVDEERKKQLNIKSIRASLIKNLYDCGYSLEEICYLTNLNILTIASYIDEDKIIRNGKKFIPKITTKHPYASLL